jgi:hypothetical protein
VDYEICPSCGTEFEYHDAVCSHAELRERWVHAGAFWHSRSVSKPYEWNAAIQLANAGLFDCMPPYIPDFQEVKAYGDEDAETLAICSM